VLQGIEKALKIAGKKCRHMPGFQIEFECLLLYILQKFSNFLYPNSGPPEAEIMNKIKFHSFDKENKDAFLQI
jgi:hypothetical protein